MAASRTRPDGVVVVSADTHVGPTPEQLRVYCPTSLLEPFDADVRRNARAGAFARARIELSEVGVAHRLGDQVQKTSLGAQGTRILRTAGHNDSTARLADMDRDGVAAGVLFHGSQNGQVLPLVDFERGFNGALPEPESRPLEAVGIKIYNRWLADFCAEAPARHVGLAKVPIWDLEESLTEVRWAADHGLRGIHFPATVSGLPSFEDPVWEPFFAACAERNLVLVTHISGAEQLAPGYTGRGAWGVRAIESSWLGRRPIWLLTFTGVFDRHPGLKLAVTELPGAWWAETVREMDAAYFGFHGRRSLQGFLERKPSEYLGTNVWVGASFQSRAEAEHAVDARAEDRMMWGSDYPHFEGTWLDGEDPSDPSVTRLSLANTFHDLGEEAIRQMVGANAVACYGLDMAALQSVADSIGPNIDELSSPPDLSALPDRYRGYGFRSHGSWS